MFRYLYCRLYSWNLKTWGENDLPQCNALFGVSFIMFLNLGLFGLILQLFGVNIFLRNELPKKEIVLIMLSLFVVNYFLFIHKGNFRLITKELKKESPKKKKDKYNSSLAVRYIIICSFCLWCDIY